MSTRFPYENIEMQRAPPQFSQTAQIYPWQSAPLGEERGKEMGTVTVQQKDVGGWYDDQKSQ